MTTIKIILVTKDKVVDSSIFCGDAGNVDESSFLFVPSSSSLSLSLSYLFSIEITEPLKVNVNVIVLN